jgi:ATPase subunit of ABC transporter with duplicated ATPase domains
MLMDGDINLLILDEPTNHLDLPSREWIEEAVAQYDETLMFISHDRYFIDRFATRIWELDNGIFTDFNGGYSQYTNWKSTMQARQEEGASGTAKAKKEPATRPKQMKKPADAQKELRRLEREIEKLEKDMESVKLTKDVFSTDYEKLMELDEREKEIKDKLDSLLEEWETLA